MARMSVKADVWIRKWKIQIRNSDTRGCHIEDGKGRVKQKDVGFGATRLIALVLQEYAVDRKLKMDRFSLPKYLFFEDKFIPVS